jgi:hypothetical protein
MSIHKKYKSFASGVNAEELAKPGVHFIRVAHDADCAIFERRECDCEPDMSVTDEAGHMEDLRKQRQAEIQARAARKYTRDLLARLRAGRTGRAGKGGR